LSLADFLSLVVRVLDDAGIPHMLTGSMAAAYYSSPRATQDLDLVIEPTAAQVDVLIERFVAEGLYVSPEAAHEALGSHGQFNFIDPASGWKADLILRRERPFSTTEFGRRAEATVLGVAIALTTLEDLIIAKLEWSELDHSELQRRDLAQLVEHAGPALDRTYIDEWVRELGLEAAWRRIDSRS
jgi:hypothetical protein